MVIYAMLGPGLTFLVPKTFVKMELLFPKLPISRENIDLFLSFPDTKKDDVADASLLALYFAQKLESPPKRPKKRRKKN